MLYKSALVSLCGCLFATAALADVLPRRTSVVVRSSDGVYRRVGGRSRKIGIPSSSIPRRSKFHTNFIVNMPLSSQAMRAQAGSVAPKASIPGLHPAEVRSAYGVTGSGQGVIAIVGAYHYSTALQDFNLFSSTFGLPTEPSGSATASTNRVFQVVYQSSTAPVVNMGWGQEAALDIEWAHAMAPGAKIVLVEANSATGTDLLAAVQKAAAIPGVKQISMSWGGSEFRGEDSLDSYFSAPGISYFASSGDTGGIVEWPSVSPSVIAVGGTYLTVSASGARASETGWSGSGGGVSSFVSRPAYQSPLSPSIRVRAVPDIAAVADPASGASVYWNGSWLVFGGTSLAAPIWAGIANSRNAWTGSAQAHAAMYQNQPQFFDVLAGTAGAFSCSAGYDLVTGVGAPLALPPGATPTPVPTSTATPAPTATPTRTATPTATPIRTTTPAPTITPTRTPTPQPTPNQNPYLCYTPKVDSRGQNVYQIYIVLPASGQKLLVIQNFPLPPATLGVTVQCPA